MGGKAFRYGGEEFLMIFPRKTADQVREFVEQVRSSIQEAKLVIIENERDKHTSAQRTGMIPSRQQVSVTASFGVSDTARNNEGFEAIKKRADELLYEAKDNGRNCIVVDGDE